MWISARNFANGAKRKKKNHPKLQTNSGIIEERSIDRVMTRETGGEGCFRASDNPKIFGFVKGANNWLKEACHRFRDRSQRGFRPALEAFSIAQAYYAL